MWAQTRLLGFEFLRYETLAKCLNFSTPHFPHMKVELITVPASWGCYED